MAEFRDVLRNILFEKIKTGFFFTIVLCAHFPSIAQTSEGNNRDTLTHKQLEEVIISSVRASSQMPVTEFTLKREEIKVNYTGQEMAVILARTPSFTWYSDGGHYTGYSTMRLRGIDQTRINFTLNGVPLNEPEDQGAYFSNYPDFLNNVQSIQVQRGVGTSTNGTTSYAGSVNFESPSLLDSAGGEIQLSYGSYRTSQLSAQYHTGLLKNKTAFYFRYSNTATDGFRDHSGTQGHSLFFGGGYFGKKSILKLTGFSGGSNSSQAYLATSKTDLEADYRINYLRPDERDDFMQTLIMLQYSATLSQYSYLQASGYYNYLSGNYEVYSDPDKLNFALQSDFWGGMANYQLEKNNINLNIGIHANQYHRKHALRVRPDLSQNLYLNDGKKTEASAFVQIIYTIDKLSLFADVQVRTVKFDYVADESVTLPFESVTWNFLNPKVGASLQLDPHRKVYVSVGKTTREPTRNDMFAGYDNIDAVNYSEVSDFTKVKPESVIDAEAGMKFSFVNFSLDANVYSMHFTNEIAAIGQLSYIGLPLRKNVPSSFRNGLEISMHARLLDKITFDTQANLSHNRIDEYTSESDNMTYKNVSPLLAPAAVINQSIGYSVTSKFDIEANVRYSDRSYLTNTNDENFTVASSLITNASMKVKIASHHTLTLMVNNLFDEKYYTAGYVANNESHYFAMATRNYYVTLNLKF
ncbi:MAG: TonB-dependent receptor [Cyclobacteriaceae bacterium]|nr:TonB-dependent receptor [Cyclobacteriaceae bacterium]